MHLKFDSVSMGLLITFEWTYFSPTKQMNYFISLFLIYGLKYSAPHEGIQSEVQYHKRMMCVVELPKRMVTSMMLGIAQEK